MSDSVQQIKDRLNIIDVVTPYVELHKAGRHFKGKSPFTKEKTPSFYVSPERGMYYCFSTSQGGDMFNFIETMEGVDFKGALKILAEKAGVELVPISPEKQTERDRLYALLEEVTKFYQSELAKNKEAEAYLKNRGVLAETIASWRIGFAPGPPEASWRATKEYLESKGFKIGELIKAGLAKETEGGKEPYDVFRNRIMFPLFDQGGRVVAFSGRTLEADKDVPKYVNSPETELFKKSEILYGYDRAKHGIRQLSFSLIVEGQFDVVMSHQAGYSNTVAVSGTALTVQHVQLLERLSNKVVLALDADKAGVSAVKRGADLMLRRGMDVKVALLSGGKDPADIVKDNPKNYKQLIGQSVHVIEFLLKVLGEESLDPRTFKLRAREEIIPYIPLLPNKIDQDHFENIVAEALKTTKDAVHFEVERLEELSSGEKSYGNKDVERSGVKIHKSEVNTAEDISTQSERILSYLLAVRTMFSETVGKRITEILETVMEIDITSLENTISVSKQAEIIFKVETQLNDQPKLMFESEVVHALNLLRTLRTKQKLRETKRALTQAELEGDEALGVKLIKEVQIGQKALQNEPYALGILKD